jgi:eukaryotic-like serine/threonine-protein kinase
MGQPDKQLLEFGPFRVDPEQRMLLRDNGPILLSPKAFDLLMVLVQRRGQVVPKDDLMKQLWPDTFVEESNLGQHVFQLRKALGDRAQGSLYIVTVPGRGYRFAGEVHQATASAETEDDLIVQSHSRSHVVIENRTRSRIRWRVVGSLAAMVVLGAGIYWRWHRSPKLTTKDTIVVGDFANSTGDPVFDGALKPALTIALHQSPFLNIFSDSKVNSTLRQMMKPSGTSLTKDVAQEVCQRDGGSAYIVGSIVRIGDTYMLGLQALNCQTGEVIAAQQTKATRKENVLAALGEAASALRHELGESLASVQKFDVPLQQATTSSLDALKAYSQAQRMATGGEDQAARLLFTRAVELDPNFALAYASLGVNYSNLGEANNAYPNLQKAFALRDRTTERERLYIEAAYYSNVSGEADRAIQTYHAWIQSYPQDPIPHARLASKYGTLGNYEEATTEMLNALKIEPDNAGDNGMLIGFYLAQERWEDAKRIERQAAARHLGGYVVREGRYYLAFLTNDEAVMHALLVGDGQSSDYLLFGMQANTEAYDGHYGTSRDYCQRGMDYAKRNDDKELGAMWQARAAWREAEAENKDIARKDAQMALALSSGLPVQSRAAMAFARAGDTAHAQELADGLDKQHPLDTMVQSYYLPSIRAAIWLDKHEPRKAIEALKNAEAYELGDTPDLYPAYLRGIAYLQGRQAKEASVEFQKLVDHPGIILNNVPGALARLQLARARDMAGDKDGARKSYRYFLNLWRDADPNLPILREAKAEYAKLQ